MSDLRCPECYNTKLVKGGYYKDGRLRWLCTACFRSTMFPLTAWPPPQSELDNEARIWKVLTRKEKRRNHGRLKDGELRQPKRSHKGPRTNQLVRRTEALDQWLHNPPEDAAEIVVVQPRRKTTWEERFGVEKATEMRRHRSETSKLRYQSDPRIQEVLAQGRLLLQTSEKAQEARRAGMKGKPKLGIRGDNHWTRKPEHRAKVDELARRKRSAWADPQHTYNTAAYREALSRGQKLIWRRPEYAELRRKANAKRPNNQEAKLIRILHDTCAKEFAYNGDLSLCVVLGGKIPDFLNINGRKQVIELFGDWWHSQEFTGVPEREAEQEMVEHYMRLGFDCLIIWESELGDGNREVLTTKIKEFAHD